ncbi:hypothetical protein GLOIN_2v1846636 [Rhizophagus irregularis DAOM 181602=DAOM 197198]|nr:hypothetical protein GLOIN_2v1846636 [Rhizophagus irregularis DAOM 181602=DAOM 197198]CAB5100617.1 unnamed protein product [Rhizophagus irregularis]
MDCPKCVTIKRVDCTKDQNTNNINVNAFNHWSRDTKQDAWFKASSLHGVIETLERKPSYVTIISDNGGHYHNTELIIILSHWKEWYNICVNKWIFLEAVEAKTAIDSHHAQITHAIKRYVKLGYEIASGKDIEMAIKDLSGTHVANLQPNREQVQTENNISKKEKQKIGTIAGIQNWNEFTWIYDGEEAGYICARPLPRFGELNKFSPCKIQKIIKDQIITQPNPIISTHSNPQKQWIIPRIDHQDSIENIEDQMSKLVEKEEKEEEVVVDLTNETEVEVDLECKSLEVFISGWALQQHQKTR